VCIGPIFRVHKALFSRSIDRIAYPQEEPVYLSTCWHAKCMYGSFECIKGSFACLQGSLEYKQGGFECT